MLQRFESFEPRRLDTRKETPEGKKAEVKRQKFEKAMQRRLHEGIEEMSKTLSHSFNDHVAYIFDPDEYYESTESIKEKLSKIKVDSVGKAGAVAMLKYYLDQL